MIWDAEQRRYEDDTGRPLTSSEIHREIEAFIAVEKQAVARESEKLLAGTITVAMFFAFMREKISAWHSIAGVIAYGGMEQMNPERWARINEKVTSEIAFLSDFQEATIASFEAVNSIAEEAAQASTVTAAEVRDAIVDAAPSEVPAILQGLGVVAAVKGASALMGGQIESRSQMYTDATYSTYENNQMAREFDNGVTLGRRICEADGTSCDECVGAATEEFIPLAEIPEIGSLQCVNNCRCEIELLGVV